MISDFHLHTKFSGDCEIPAKQQVEQAISLGMKEICITDHHDYGMVVDGIDFNLNLEAYLPYLKELQLKYRNQIRINLGIELGLQRHILPYLEKLSILKELDFVIGSSHFIDGMDPYFPEFFEGRTERAAYEHFFSVSHKRIQMIDCFHSFGHLDYVVRYGPDKNRFYDYKTYSDYIDAILKTLIEKGKALECNTGGYRYGLGHPNPCEDILIRYRELGGELLTVGSDAHSPEYLGYEFQRTETLLKQCGYRYYTVYHQQKPEFIPLE